MSNVDVIPAVVQVQAGQDALLEELVDIDAQVDAAEEHGIMRRWEFGRLLLEERERNGGKQLPHGRLDEVCAVTGRSQAEIRYRVLFAAKYPEREKVVTAVTTLRSWTAVRDTLSDDKGEKSAHVSNNAGENEWYTPVEFIEAARAVMGGIDLDPASNATANAVVGASVFFTKDENGLERPWVGRVWMNPPYAQPLVGQFCERLVRYHDSTDVSEACVLVNNATETEWFATLVEPATAVCFPKTRVKFWHPERVSAPLQGQAIVYLGANVEKFREAFSEFGWTAQR